jgi:hypothetical protein
MPAVRSANQILADIYVALGFDLEKSVNDPSSFNPSNVNGARAGRLRDEYHASGYSDPRAMNTYTNFALHYLMTGQDADFHLLASTASGMHQILENHLYAALSFLEHPGDPLQNPQRAQALRSHYSLDTGKYLVGYFPRTDDMKDLFFSLGFFGNPFDPAFYSHELFDEDKAKDAYKKIRDTGVAGDLQWADWYVGESVFHCLTAADRPLYEKAEEIADAFDKGLESSCIRGFSNIQYAIYNCSMPPDLGGQEIRNPYYDTARAAELVQHFGKRDYAIQLAEHFASFKR